MKKSIAVFLTVILMISMSVVVASADDFVPSSALVEIPELIPDPEVNEGKLPEGVEAEDVVAVIKSDEEDDAYVTFDDIVQISVSEAKGKDDDVSKALVNAFEAIQKDGVKSVKSIVAAAEDLGIKNPKLNATNIFEVNLGEHTDALNKEGASVVLTFANESKAEQGKLIVAHMVDGEWKTIAKDKVEVTKDVIRVEFDSLCPVMFINATEDEEATDVATEETDAATEETKPVVGAPTAPVDDDNNVKTIIIIVVVCVVVAGAAVAIYFLYKNGKFDGLIKKKEPVNHPERSVYKKSKKAKRWSSKKQIRRQRRSRRSGK